MGADVGRSLRATCPSHKAEALTSLGVPPTAGEGRTLSAAPLEARDRFSAGTSASSRRRLLT